MTSYDFGEIILIAFPQTGTTIKKKRPALVILDTGDADLVLAPVTSRKRSSPGDVSANLWAEAGLLRPSWIRLAKIACLEKRGVLRRLGKLRAGDCRELAETWRRLYSLEIVGEEPGVDNEPTSRA